MINTSQNMLYHISNLNSENERITYQMATGTNQDKGSEDSILYSDLIDLDDIWEWLGFNKKCNTTVCLDKNFIKEVDYLIFAPERSGAKNTGIRHNKLNYLNYLNNI